MWTFWGARRRTLGVTKSLVFWLAFPLPENIRDSSGSFSGLLRRLHRKAAGPSTPTSRGPLASLAHGLRCGMGQLGLPALRAAVHLATLHVLQAPRVHRCQFLLKLLHLGLTGQEHVVGGQKGGWGGLKLSSPALHESSMSTSW